jgi:hypothetical protein
MCDSIETGAWHAEARFGALMAIDTIARCKDLKRAMG